MVKIWMEIRGRGNDANFGEELYAERGTQGLQERVSYNQLVKAHPGDVVLHWQEGAFWGVSTVVSKLEDDGDKVRVRTGNYSAFSSPVGLSSVRGDLKNIRKVQDDLEAVGNGKYFPFQINHRGTEEEQLHGPMSWYFVAFPEELVYAIDELRTKVRLVHSLDYGDLLDEVDSGDNPPRETNPDRRKAVELWAEKCAILHYEDQGYQLEDRPGRPYDLKFTLGAEELHVEVKGSSTRVDSVFLTKNEIGHASGKGYRTSLYVVDDIRVSSLESGYETSGGRERFWEDWSPESKSLTALQFAYKLPDK